MQEKSQSYIKRVLVVDDEAPVRFTAINIITEAGYRPDEACSLIQARLMIVSAYTHNRPFSLILLDHDLLKTNNVDFFGEVQKNAPCPPIILMAEKQGYESAAEPPAAIQVVASMTKPFTPVDLTAHLHNFFEHTKH